jgi:predicted extracellular nuclease
VKGRIAALSALVCALAFMVGGAGAVPSTTLVISQVYGGGGNTGAPYTNDYVEIFNRGSSTVSLSGYSVQYASATGTGNFGANPVTPLSGTLAPGQYYLVQQLGGANGVPLPTPDAVGTVNMSATGGKVIIANTTSGLACNGGSAPCSAAQLAQIVDLIGYDGANFFEGAPAPTLSNTTAALRGAGGCTETDNNATDFAAGTPTPRNTASTFNPCPTTTTLSVNDVSAQEGNSGTTSFTFTVGLSSPAGAGGVTFDIATADGTATTADGDYLAQSLTGQMIPEGNSTYAFTAQVNGDTATEPDETFFVNVTNVTGATVGDGQGQGTIVNDDVCGLPFTPIYTIQGSGASTPIPGNVTTQGVVVGDFEGTAAGSGFYLQDATGDGDAATSDGIFVFTGSSNLVSAGQVVRVTGFARERFNQTTINGTNSNTSPVTNVVACGTGSVGPTDVTMPFAALDSPERYEGMLVRFPQPLVISEYFNYDRFGEIVLGLPLDGETRPFTGTAIDQPGAPANARTLANTLRRITLDDVQSAQNPLFLRHPNGGTFSLANLFRGGDRVQNAVGVLGFEFNLYRIYPTGPADYTATNPRPAAPEPVGGTLRVAAMNTLNFFITGDYPTGDPLDNKCGPAQNLECRGHDADQPAEFTRQRDKLLAALVGLNGDVVGLNELENTTGVDPLGGPSGVVPGLNAALGAGTYAAIDTGTIGTDAIKVGLIYKPAKVTPVGDYKLLTSAVDPRFLDTKSRPVLAQTFEVIATGARFTVAVNHLKSKGSACDDVGDPDTGDGQGNCNVTRTRAAQALVDWLATDPTGSGDPDFLIIGDLNSYAQEDPIDAVKAGPDDAPGTADDYTNLVGLFLGTYAYSFVFDGMAGYLDHALSSPSLTSQVSGVAEWHIDADESDVVDYDTSFKPPEQEALYQANAYRASDHDPILVGLTAKTSYADLCRLTRLYTSSPGVADALCEKLATAEQAEAAGDLKTKANAIRSYVKQVQAQSGKTIAPDKAALLIQLANTL